MTPEQIKIYQRAAELGTIPDDKNPLFLFSTTDSNLLLRILNNDFDLKTLVRRELEKRSHINDDIRNKYASSQLGTHAKRTQEGIRKRKGKGL